MKIYAIHFKDRENNVVYVFSTPSKGWAENYVNAYNKRCEDTGKPYRYYFETIEITEDKE